MATQTEDDHKNVDSEEVVDSDATNHEDAAESSSGSYTDIYEDDPTYDGPVYHSQPCMSGIHGASYTPPGWRRRTIKRKSMRLLENRAPSSSDETENETDSA